MELDFKGTAIYVHFLLGAIQTNDWDPKPLYITQSACNFTLDGGEPTLFNEATGYLGGPLNLRPIVAYSRINLPNVDHKLVISLGGNREVSVLFDYAEFTHDDEPTPPPASTSSSSTPSDSHTTQTASPQDSQMPDSNASTTIHIHTTPETTPPQSSQIPDPNNSATTSSRVNVGAIAGGAAGGVTAIIAIILGVFALCRRRRFARSRGTFDIDIDEELPKQISPDTNGDISNGSIVPFHVDTPYRDDPHSPSNFAQPTSPYSDDSFYSPSTSRITSAVDPNGTRVLSLGALSDSASIRGGVPSGSSGHGGSNATAATTTFFVANDTSAAQDSDREAIRQARQAELDRKLHAVEQEIQDLDGKQPSGSQGNNAQSATVAELQEQMRVMMSQIDHLKNQQQSDWAQGLSDEAPPEYEPSHSGNLAPSDSKAGN
ncbi:hypothetical protein DXG03_009204 [Asterophora parasitica]|uniref:Uncharacterized protein n=1 Tax=Asterophora parasitica TaxID=117018 RepID=A0A9P7GBL1_9AGAR|nr:hypothetical protein DXG03_009204 [Asterophora parasitica]